MMAPRERARRWPARAAALALCLAAAGCASPLRRGLAHLEKGRLPEAAAELRSLESEFHQMSATERARYSLHRGIAELALGHVTRAHGWLGAARRLELTAPGTLSAAERGKLWSAWRSLGLMPGEEG